MLDLRKLERLAKNATPGPWYTLSEMCEGVGCDTIISKQGEICDFVGNMHNPYGDRSYIVAACNAVPELIAEIRNLQKEVLTLAEENACLKKQAAASETKHKKQVRVLERQAETLARYLAEKCLDTVTAKRWLDLAYQSAVRSEERRQGISDYF